MLVNVKMLNRVQLHALVAIAMQPCQFRLFRVTETNVVYTP
jgi:hypothetical protein